MTASLFLAPIVLAPKAGDIETLVRKAIADRGVPSVSVAVWRDGQEVFSRAYGSANIETDTPATPRTVYRIASITKTFTSTLILQLVSEGKLGLDQPVRSVVAWLPEAWKPVTIRQLLNHSSGLPDYTSEPAAMGWMRETATPRKVVETVVKRPLVFEPGSKHAYCNTGYVLLGIVAETVETGPFAELLRRRVAGPLRLKSVRLGVSDDVTPGRASGYIRPESKTLNAPYLDLGWPAAAGSIEATASDVARWGWACLSGDAIPATLRTEAWTEAIPESKYGLGWITTKRNGIAIIGHNGGIHGFSSMLMMVPSQKLAISVLANLEGMNVGLLAGQIAELFEPGLKAKAAPAIQDSDPALTARFEGIVRQLLAGEVPQDVFSEAMLKVLTPAHVKATAGQLAEMGKLLRLTLQTEKTSSLGRDRVYRAVFERGEMTLSVTIGKDGKIIGLGMSP